MINCKLLLYRLLLKVEKLEVYIDLQFSFLISTSLKKKKMVDLGEKLYQPYFKIFFPFYFHSNQLMENHIFLQTFSNLTFHPISCYFFHAWSKWNSSCTESSCNSRYWLLMSSDSSPTTRPLWGRAQGQGGE